MGRELSAKGRASLLGLGETAVALAPWAGLEYCHRRLDQPLDLGARRLLKEEKIPAAENVFSRFEAHAEWIQKGKPRPTVELGHRRLLATDPHISPPIFLDTG